MGKRPSIKIGVLGCAIAGLSAGIAAARAGHQVTIFGPVPKTLSGALQLAPNGFSALHRLGMMADVAPHLTRLSAIELRSASTMSCLAVIDHDNPHHRDYASIGRDDLHKALLHHAQADKRIQFCGDEVSHLAPKADETYVVAGGARYDFDMLIGADGKSGIARQSFQKQTDPPVMRQALRAQMVAAALPQTFRTKRTQLWLGDGYHLVSYPFAGGDFVNLVLCTSYDVTGIDVIKTHPILSCLASDDIAWHHTPLPEASQLATWRKYQLILIGDAAHFMPPHLAQGAGQTLEDAASLYEALCQDAPLSSILRDWALMRARTLAPIIEKAEETGAVMRLKGPFARLRNMAIALGGQRLVERWLRQVWQE